MASQANDLDPVVVLIADTELAPRAFNEWLALVALNEPVDIGMSAVDLISEAREHGEV